MLDFADPNTRTLFAQQSEVHGGLVAVVYARVLA